MRIIFGARLPQRGERRSTDRLRADLLIQLRALADETRLRVLELLLEEGERSAQEIIARLGLTRSSASRHLSQLTATGYLTERLGPGKAKRYALNPGRFQDTARLVERYGQP